MAQKRETQEVKLQAIELAKRRFTPREISKVIPGGFKSRTIREWIRDSGEVPSNEELACSLWREGKGADEIASRLRITRRGVNKILAKFRGLTRTVHSPQENVKRFLTNPEASLHERFARSEPFGRELILECVKLSDRGKDSDIQKIEAAIVLFTYLHSTTRNAEMRELAACRRLQVRGIKAYMLMRANEFELAIEILKENLRDGRKRRCLACEADTWRRLGVAYGEMKNWALGEGALYEAFDRYFRLASDGHDLFGSGLGSCFLARSLIQLYSTSSQAAIRSAEAGLSLLKPIGRAEPLYGMLIFALAAAIAKSDQPEVAAIRRARRLLAEASKILDSATLTITQIKITWLNGLLAALEGNESEAMTLLVSARDDAKTLKAENVVVALTADITRLDPKPRHARANILDLCDATESGQLYLPEWLKAEALRAALQEAQVAALEAARQSRLRIEEAVITRLRDASGAAHLMPDLLLAA